MAKGSFILLCGCTTFISIFPISLPRGDALVIERRCFHRDKHAPLITRIRKQARSVSRRTPSLSPFTHRREEEHKDSVKFSFSSRKVSWIFIFLLIFVHFVYIKITIVKLSSRLPPQSKGNNFRSFSLRQILIVRKSDKIDKIINDVSCCSSKTGLSCRYIYPTRSSPVFSPLFVLFYSQPTIANFPLIIPRKKFSSYRPSVATAWVL